MKGKYLCFRIGKKQLQIDPFFPAFITLLLLIDRSGNLPYLFSAILIHECGHLLMLSVCRIQIKTIRLCPFALEIITKGQLTGTASQAAVSFGGAGANLLSALLFSILHHVCSIELFSDLAICNGAVALLQLLPVFSFDGYQLVLIFSKNYRCAEALSRITLSALFVCSAALIYYRKNPLLLLFCLNLLIIQLLCAKKENGARLLQS